MKRMIAFAAASMIAAAAPSLAQDTTAPAAGGATSPDAAATVDATTAPTVSDLIAAIEANGTSADQVEMLTTVASVKIVKIGDLAAGDEAGLLQAALADHQEDTARLRNAVEANPALKAELDKQQVEASAIVATKMEADGSLTVFVQ